MRPPQPRRVKLPIVPGQLQRHRVHPRRPDLNLALARQREDVPPALPVVGDKVQVVAVHANTMQIMGLPETDEGAADVLEGEGDLVPADVDEALSRVFLARCRPDRDGSEEAV